jgi:hypothetical protein
LLRRAAAYFARQLAAGFQAFDAVGNRQENCRRMRRDRRLFRHRFVYRQTDLGAGSVVACPFCASIRGLFCGVACHAQSPAGKRYCAAATCYNNAFHANSLILLWSVSTFHTAYFIASVIANTAMPAKERLGSRMHRSGLVTSFITVATVPPHEIFLVVVDLRLPVM